MARSFRNNRIRNDLEEFLQRAEDTFESLEGREVNYRFLVGSGDTLTFKIGEHTDMKDFDVRMQNRIKEWKETRDLIDSIKQDLGFDIDDRYIYNIVRVCFNYHRISDRNCEYDVDEIYNNIVLDSEGKSKTRGFYFVQSVNVENEIIIDNNLRILPIRKADGIYKERIDGLASTHGSPISWGFPTSIIRLDVTNSPKYDAINASQAASIDFLIKLLRILGPSNADVCFSKIEPVSYLDTGRTSTNSGRDTHPKLKFSPIDIKRLKNLRNLLEEYYDGNSREFTSFFSVPFQHYDTSIEQRTRQHSSIAFSVIGLESLYKQNTKSELKSSKGIALNAAFVLGSAIDSLDPHTVKQDVLDAYNKRNNFVHGDHGSENTEKRQQHRMWDYLRFSLVIFTILHSRGIISQNAGLNLDDSYINQDERGKVQRQLRNIDLNSYVQI